MYEGGHNPLYENLRKSAKQTEPLNESKSAFCNRCLFRQGHGIVYLWSSSQVCPSYKGTMSSLWWLIGSANWHISCQLWESQLCLRLQSSFISAWWRHHGLPKVFVSYRDSKLTSAFGRHFFREVGKNYNLLWLSISKQMGKWSVSLEF